MEMRKCAYCKNKLPLDSFSINPKSAEYYVSCDRCRLKTKSYREANKETIAEKSKAHYEANKEKITEQRKAYREANRDKILAQKKTYREANKEKIAEHYKAYREANRDKIAERDKAYREANKETIAEKSKAYRSSEEYKIKKAKSDKAYYEANKEKIAEWKKSYREANKEKIAEQRKARYEANKEKIAEQHKAYYEANKEKIAEHYKAYREANKEKIAEREKAYRSSEEFKIKKAKSDKAYRNKFAMYNSWKDSFNKNDCKEGENGILLVKCKYCNNWFSPSNNEVQHYNNYGIGLYCSKGCKKSCPSFNAPNGIEKKPRQNTSREVQPELRKLVLERDNWTCQKCGANKEEDITVTLHCHHIDPVKNNPIESADMDNCVTLCKACHKEVHKQKGCRYSDLASCKIEY